jgi:hypothetical protein
MKSCQQTYGYSLEMKTGFNRHSQSVRTYRLEQKHITTVLKETT